MKVFGLHLRELDASSSLFNCIFLLSLSYSSTSFARKLMLLTVSMSSNLMIYAPLSVSMSTMTPLPIILWLIRSPGRNCFCSAAASSPRLAVFDVPVRFFYEAVAPAPRRKLADVLSMLNIKRDGYWYEPSKLRPCASDRKSRSCARVIATKASRRSSSIAADVCVFLRREYAFAEAAEEHVLEFKALWLCAPSSA